MYEFALIAVTVEIEIAKKKSINSATKTVKKLQVGISIIDELYLQIFVNTLLS